MKFDGNNVKGGTVILIILAFIISCATGVHPIHHKDIPVLYPATSADGLLYIPIETKPKQDTSLKARIAYRKKVEEFMKRMEQRSADTYSDVHNLRDLNILLQTQHLDLVNRLSIRRDENDSLKKFIILKLTTLQDTLNETKKQSATYYHQAQQAQQQIRIVNDTYNWQFATLGVLILVSTIGSSIVKYRWIKKYSV